LDILMVRDKDFGGDEDTRGWIIKLWNENSEPVLVKEQKINTTLKLVI
jgi:hypothetical protein